MMNRRVNISSFLAALVILPVVDAHAGGPIRLEKGLGANPRRGAQEGQVNVYIYRYEGLLQDFKRDFPGINVVAVTGRGNDLTNRIMAERRGGSLSLTFIAAAPTVFTTRCTKAKRSIRFKPLLILPEVTDLDQMVRQGTSLRRSGGKIHLCLHRLAEQRAAGLQYQYGEPERVQILSADVTQSEVERQNRLPRSARYRPGRDHAVLLLQPGNRPGVHEEIFRRHGYYLREELPANDQLAGAGKFAICMGCKDSARAKKQGLPVEDFDTNHWKEGSSFSAGGGSVSYLNQAPHPNAAKFSSTGFCRAEARSRCRSSAMRTIRPTRGASIFPKTTSRRKTGCSRE